ncbi:MAG: hypothetical protein H6728_00630 [Myxococcales bacterium]|nr:hypothetical protein [Myxococcales bacterium]MCB9641569.1 hypothetical protein [Myxococcales bacterium]
MRKIMLLGTLFFLGVVGCGGDGKLAVSVWGEAFIEEKIPATEVVDGWEIEFTKFLVVVGGIETGSAAGATGPSVAGFKVFNLREKGEQLLSEFVIPSGTWDRLAYSVSPANAETQVGNASAEDAKMMKDAGYSIYLEGTARKDGQSKTFAWGFKTNTQYTGCKSERAVVQVGATAKTQLTIHADHFFYDDLEDPDAKVRFQTIADADKDNDGKITLEELAAVNGADFAGLAHYGVGRFAEVKDLRAFVEHLSRTLGHIDGEGHCDVKL